MGILSKKNHQALLLLAYSLLQAATVLDTMIQWVEKLFDNNNIAAEVPSNLVTRIKWSCAKS